MAAGGNAPANNNLYDWNNDQDDHYSFEDSDRFEDESLCSWIGSETESVTNNWRGWKKCTNSNPGSSSVTSNFHLLNTSHNLSSVNFSICLTNVPCGHNNTNSSSNLSRFVSKCPSGQVLSLTEMSARMVACYIPFEVVEHVFPPVPENLQLRIAFWSFPDNEEDIRLYSCLANGSPDEFNRGENLLKANCVRELLQIGFHLSATVYPVKDGVALIPANNNAGHHQGSHGATINVTKSSSSSSSSCVHNVAVTFDRRKITSCDCTCSSTSSWCSHVVAVCLHRIHNLVDVRLRAPVSESLSRLDRDQLRKFAQYLIAELPQQILPTAQRLLDDLLSCSTSKINVLGGAPDPTAGASIDQVTSWCLDESQLHENIKKIVVKLCQPMPAVYPDPNFMTATAPPAASEWNNLLKPLRGREPEGMWNLLSIVREMFRRGDHNSIPLLEILTHEILDCEQIILWWFNTRVALGGGGNNHHSGNSGGNHPGGNSSVSRFGVYASTTSQCQQSCSTLCDEIVTLWRLANLNPRLNPQNKDLFFKQLIEWHVRILEKVARIRSSSGGNHHHHHNHNHNHGPNPNPANPVVGGGAANPPGANNQHQQPANGNNGLHLGPAVAIGHGNSGGPFRKTDFEIFPGFKPALEAALIQWDNPEHFVYIPGKSLSKIKDQDKINLESNPESCLKGRGRSVDICPSSSSDWRVNTLNSSSLVLPPVANSGATVDTSLCSSSSSKHVNNLLQHQTSITSCTSSSSSSSSNNNIETSGQCAAMAGPMAANAPAPQLPIGDHSNRSSFSSEGFCEQTFEQTPSSSSNNVVPSSNNVLEPTTSSTCDTSSSSKVLLCGNKSMTHTPSTSSSQPVISSSVSNLIITSGCNSIADLISRSQSCLSSSSSSCNQIIDPIHDIVIKKIEDPLEILFARAEALHVHGFGRESCKLAIDLAEKMLLNPPNLLPGDLPIAPVRSKAHRKRFNPISHQISLLASTTLSKAAFLVSALTENLETHDLAFKMGLFGLQLARPPASTKALEVKLAHQESDLVLLLKRIPLQELQLQQLRNKAIDLRDGNLKSRGDALLPLLLASYIFESLVLNNPAANPNPSSLSSSSSSSGLAPGRHPGDAQLGFEAAVAALGLKANVSEAEHPLLCEGTRRNRQELALALLVTYKDDPDKLAMIMDKLLDRDIHKMYKDQSPGFSNYPGYNSLVKNSAVNPSTSSSANPTPVNPNPVVNPVSTSSSGESTLSSSNSDQSLESRDAAAPTATISATNPTASSSATTADVSLPSCSKMVNVQDKMMNADKNRDQGSDDWDENYKQWEARFRCTNLKTSSKKHSVGMASIDSSAPETTSSDNSPTVIRRALWIRGPGVPNVSTGPPSDSGSSGESSSSSDSSIASNSESKNSNPNPIPSCSKNVLIAPAGSKLPAPSPSSPSSPSASSSSHLGNSFAASVADRLANVAIGGSPPASCSSQPCTPPRPSATTPNSAMIHPGGNLSSSSMTPMTPNNNNMITPRNTPPSQHSSQLPLHSSASAPNLTPHQMQQQQQQTSGGKVGSRFKGRKIYPSLPNQPSEAMAHFMFELSKSVLAKAGGNSSPALFTQHQPNVPNRSPHRALHMCAFQLGVYALGIQNAVSPNWKSRTYSSSVTWITNQAIEIGASAIQFLIDTWEDHLTPDEVCKLADRASQNRDPAMVRCAARLALKCLPRADNLNFNEIQRALIQCKDQSNELLEEACLAVESAAKDGGVNPEVLFEVARKWFELYEESLASSNLSGHRSAASSNNNASHHARVVQASVGEFQVGASNQDHNLHPHSHFSSSSASLSAASSSSQFNIGQNIPHHPHPQAVVVAAAAPSLPPGAPLGHHYNSNNQTGPGYAHYPYQAYGAMVPFSSHAANFSAAAAAAAAFQGMQAAAVAPSNHPYGNYMNPHNPYAYVGPNTVTATTATALVTAAAAALNPNIARSMMSPEFYHSGSPLIANVVVTQAAAAIAQNHHHAHRYHSHQQQQQQMQQLSAMYHHHQHMAAAAMASQQQQHAMYGHHGNNGNNGQGHGGGATVQNHQLPQLSPRQVTFLLSAYRVGMLAMGTLSRRVHDDRPAAKYAKNPSYGEDVKWLLSISMKLGTPYLHEFCHCAGNAVASPFVLLDILQSSAKFLSSSTSIRLHEAYRSQTIQPLINKCQQMFIGCAHHKIQHITPSDYEEFISMIHSARAAFNLTPSGNTQFNELLTSLMRQKNVKKDLKATLNSLRHQHHVPDHGL